LNRGDAPINIRIINIKSVAGLKAAVSRILKPAVLGVIEVKTQAVAFSPKLIP